MTSTPSPPAELRDARRRPAVLRVVSGLALGLAVTSVLRHGLLPLEQQNIDSNLYASSAYNLVRGNGYVGVFDGEEVRSWFPPGLPVLLAPWTFVGEYPENVQIASLGMTVMLVVLMWELAREIAGHVAAAVTALLASGSALLTDGSRILSDVPAAVAALAAILAVRHRRWSLAGALCGVSAAIRLTHVAFLAACRRWRALVTAVAVLAPVVIFNLVVFGAVTGYTEATGGWSLSYLAGDVTHELVLRPDLSRPVSELANWQYYPMVLAGRWGHVAPGAVLLGLYELWQRRMDAAARFAAVLALSTVAVYLFWYRQAPRFMVTAAAILVTYAGCAATRLVEAFVSARRADNSAWSTVEGTSPAVS